MRITENQIHRLSEKLLNALVERDGTTLKAERGTILAHMEEIIRANLAQEESLDRDAEKLLEAHLRSAPPGMDRQKVLQMIKKKLAEERGIPL